MPVEYGSLPVRLAEYPEVPEFFAESILGIMPQSMVQPMSFHLIYMHFALHR